MINNDTRKKLADIIHGNVIEGQNGTLSAACNNLRGSFTTNTKIKKDFDYQSTIKEKQKEHLIEFINQHQLWHPDISEDKYLTEGGEAKIYFGGDNKTVVKLNDAIYYSTWLDFFNSILIHNLFFDRTAYALKGFIQKGNVLCAILEQPFIIADNPTVIADIKTFLNYNGFEIVRRYDYYNKQLGLLLEDIHDENVLTNANTLFFIDTVFYIDVDE
ncbi:MAG TPA: hypothetical protein VHZ50_05545 [Puia sp.]|jgi:hypothetical protein|nr:hypothetical protein [Puia sp.]